MAMRPVVMLVMLVGLTACSPYRSPPRWQPRPTVEPAPAVDPFADLETADAEAIPHEPFRGAARILRLADGRLLIRAGLQIDADGSPNARIRDPRHGRLETSHRYPGVVGQARFVDAEQAPYVCRLMGFAERFGIALGDLVAVSYRGSVVFAIFADVGPADRLGEGSIKLAELLGHHPWDEWEHGETLSTHGGISAPVVRYLVFPGEQVPGLSPATAAEAIARAGRRLTRPSV